MSLLDELLAFNRAQKLAFLAVSYGYFTVFCPGVLHAPFLPAEAVRYGVDSRLTGIIFGVSALLVVVFGPPIGMAIAKFGPKTCIMAGIFLNATFNILFGFLEYSPSRDWFILGAFICSGLPSIGFTTIFTATITFAAKMFPENLSLVVGLLEVYIASAEFVGLSSGGFLYDLGGLKLPFIIFGLLHLLAVPLDYFMLPPDQERNQTVARTSGSSDLEADNERSNNTKSLENGDVKLTENNIRPWDLLMIPRTMLMILIVFTAGICWSFLTATLERHLAPLELSKTQVNSMFLITSVGYGIAGPLWGFVADKIERTWLLMTSGMIVSGITFFFLGPLPIFGLGNTVWLNGICLAVITFALSAINVSACKTCLMYTVEAGHADGVATYAIVSSMISTFNGAGRATGAFSSGYLVEGIGYPYSAAFFGSLSIGYSTIILFYFLVCSKPKIRLGEDSSQESGRRSTRLQSLIGTSNESHAPAASAKELNLEK